MTPFHSPEQAQVFGFLSAFVKRASLGCVGVDRPVRPILAWNRRFQALPDSERTKLAAFVLELLPGMHKVGGGGVAGALGTVVRRVSRPIRSAMHEWTPPVRLPSPRVPFRPPGMPRFPQAAVPAASAAAPAAGAAAPAAEAAAAAGRTVPTWMSSIYNTYAGMKPLNKLLLGAGIALPTYQYAQGDLGPAGLAANVAASVLGLRYGTLGQVATGLGGSYLGGKVDEMIGWKPMEQRLQEAQLAGQQQGQQAAAGELEQLLSQRSQAAPQPQTPFLSPSGLTYTSPVTGQAVLRPDLQMGAQMAERQMMGRVFPQL